MYFAPLDAKNGPKATVFTYRPLFLKKAAYNPPG